MEEISDEQLVDEFMESGELRHFDALVRRHIGRVRAMIYPMVLNNADADDLTQQVFLRVMNGISRFRRKASFSTWLYRITVNTTRSFLKQAWKRKLEFTEEIPESADGRKGPSAILEGQELNRQVSQALASLPDHLRMAITLTAINGMNAQEAASAEGCLVATMYWRLHEARKMLKHKLTMVQS